MNQSFIKIFDSFIMIFFSLIFLILEENMLLFPKNSIPNHLDNTFHKVIIYQIFQLQPFLIAISIYHFHFSKVTYLHQPIYSICLISTSKHSILIRIYFQAQNISFMIDKPHLINLIYFFQVHLLFLKEFILYFQLIFLNFRV